MAERYTSPAGLSSLSVDGIEHKVDPDTGELIVNVQTPNLARELKDRGCQRIPDDAPPTRPWRQPAALTPAEESEKKALITELTQRTGRAPDGRRSLPQLREMKTTLDAQKGAA